MTPYLHPTQLGFGTPGGCAAIVHSIRMFLRYPSFGEYRCFTALHQCLTRCVKKLDGKHRPVAVLATVTEDMTPHVHPTQLVIGMDMAAFYLDDTSNCGTHPQSLPRTNPERPGCVPPRSLHGRLGGMDHPPRQVLLVAGIRLRTSSLLLTRTAEEAGPSEETRVPAHPPPVPGPRPRPPSLFLGCCQISCHPRTRQPASGFVPTLSKSALGESSMCPSPKMLGSGHRPPSRKADSASATLFSTPQQPSWLPAAAQRLSATTGRPFVVREAASRAEGRTGQHGHKEFDVSHQSHVDR